MKLIKMMTIFASAGALMLAAACEGGPSLGGLNNNVSSVNYAAGSPLGSDLPGRDARALSLAFVKAMEGGAAGEAASWTGASARGAITPGAHKAGNLRANPDELLDFRSGLRLSRRFETELGQYVLTRNANVRYGPSTDSEVAEILPSGAGVEVVGKTVDDPWMLVAVEGRILGFVYEKLMIRRPGAELELAGGPTRRPHLCRPFDQTLMLDGRTDRWSGIACDRGDGNWVLQLRDENAPTRLF